MAAQAEELRSSYVPRSLDAHIKWLEQIDASCGSYKQQFTQNWSKAAQVYRGDNWDSRKEGNPFFKTNLARAKLDRKAAKFTVSKPIFGVMPIRSGLTVAARVLNQTINALWDGTLEMQMRLEQLSAFVRPFGCGFMKTVWDPRGSNGLGDVATPEIDPRAIKLDPYTLRSYDVNRSLIIIHETSVPFTWVRDNFLAHANEVEDFDAPPPRQDDRLVEQGAKFQMGGPIRTPLRGYLGGMRTTGVMGKIIDIPYVRVREFWYADPRERDDKSIYPNGRATYLVGSGRKAVIVNPEEGMSQNPFWDGQYPFDLYDARPDIDHPYGSSQVEDIRRLEEALNRSGHMALRQLMKNVSMIIADGGALTPDYLKRLSDFGDVVINKQPGREVNRIPAQNAVTDAISLGNYVMQLMDMTIGLGGDAVSGKGRVEVRSPDLLYGLQDSQQDLINQETRREEQFLERVGTKIVSRILQFYRTDRFIPYVTSSRLANFQFEVKQLRQEIHQIAFDAVSAKLINEDEGDEKERGKRKGYNFETVKIAVEEALKGAWKQFRFKIVPLSSLATTRAARAKVLSEFVQQDAVPMRLLMEEAGFDNSEDLQRERLEEKKKTMELYQSMGVEPPQPAGQKKAPAKK